MAFHVACPITCRRICYCSLGFSRSLHGARAKNGFLEEVFKLEKFLSDPWGIKGRGIKGPTVQVAVPKVLPPPPPPQPVAVVSEGFGGAIGAEDAAAVLSAQTKRVALQRQAAAAMVAAEDYARRFEHGNLVRGKPPTSSGIYIIPPPSLSSPGDSSGGPAGEEQGSSTANVMCRICFFGENEGSERARRMLSCKSCGKKYHRSCLKSWAQHRDLFHWSSWTCPSCRICEICRRTGDPNKFMFCKRCDGAYHCYCMHPPHKNVSSGPYLCPKHTKCHSCASNVPGNGQSVRWFLGYTCCDACGRLFVKGNYCPVCLKVYRDSESTPMVCCDVCERWVHCQCDGISDEKYLQFQVDGNLRYKCATCRGESYQVKDLEDAVQELWRRRDKTDRDLVASLRAAAGFPSQEEIFCISPYSDDEENGPLKLKNEFGRSLKFSFKGLVEKSPKKTKDYAKKSSNKKKAKKKGFLTSLTNEAEPNLSSGRHDDTQQLKYGLGDEKNNEMVSHKTEGSDMYSSPVARSHSHTEGVCSINQPGVLKHKFIDEVMASDEDKKLKVRIKSNKPHGMDSEEDAGKEAARSKSAKGKKLVINLGSRKINVTNSPRSDASSSQREQDLMKSSGDKVDNYEQSKGSKVGEEERGQISSGKVRSEVSNTVPKFGNGSSASGNETVPPKDILVFSRKRNAEGVKAVLGSAGEVSTLRDNGVSSGKLSESKHHVDRDSNEEYGQTPVPDSLPRDLKPLLKFKFKKPVQIQNSPHFEEEKISIKGQRSKRKRSSLFVEKISFNKNDAKQQHQENLADEIMDANWILKKLGKDAIGKRVEVHHSIDNSWHKGVVTNIIDGTSALSVTLDDGKVKTLELGKQGIRFVPQKQKRLKSLKP